MHATIDQGAVGFPAWQWAFGPLRLRGSIWFDPWHRLANDVKECVVGAGLWLTLLECVAVWNVFTGPYEKAAHWGKVCCAAETYLRCANDDDPLFQLVFENIAQDHQDECADYLSVDHARRVWTRLSSSKVLKGKGDRVKLGRWLSWWDAADARADCWHEQLLFCLYHGVREGWWKSIQDEGWEHLNLMFHQ